MGACEGNDGTHILTSNLFKMPSLVTSRFYNMHAKHETFLCSKHDFYSVMMGEHFICVWRFEGMVTNKNESRLK